MELTDNLNIKQFKPLISPAELRDKLPQTDSEEQLVVEARNAISQILVDRSSRRIVIAGPCSLHDKQSSVDYAGRLFELQQKVSDKLLIVMRAYFEKPRTTLGWKGLLYDPTLDGSYHIEEGFHIAREILLEISNIGLPIATEFLDPIVPQYISDLVSWAAIGARTTESQVHRQMASGLSMPIGFKNSTNGNPVSAIDAIKASSSPHAFMGINREGQVIIAETKGNKFGHLVMRGGTEGPNYASEYISFVKVLLEKAGIPTGIIIDCSHANSGKDHKKQRVVMDDIYTQIRQGDSMIAGIMLESFIGEGNQPIKGDKRKYGVSLTDKCIGWEETQELIGKFADAV